MSVDLDKMRRSGQVTAGALAAVAQAVRPGVTTGELDQLAEGFIRDHRGTPAFLGFGGFPATLCTSVNAQVVHGIPGEYVLAEGDIIGMDVGVKIDGWYTDAALTIGVGEISGEAQRLLELTHQALQVAVATARVGRTTGDLGAAVEKLASEASLGIVRDCSGHGIGRKLHMEPSLPNFGQAGSGSRFKAGQALAIEPMLVTGEAALELAPDKWTLSTRDGGLAAHFEETVLVTEGDPERLTPLDAALAALGAEVPAGRFSKVAASGPASDSTQEEA